MPKVVEMMKEGGDKNLELYQEGMEHTKVVIQWQRKGVVKLDQLSKLRVMFLGSFGQWVSRLNAAKSAHAWLGGREEDHLLFSVPDPNQPQHRSLSDEMSGNKTNHSSYMKHKDYCERMNWHTRLSTFTNSKFSCQLQ